MYIPDGRHALKLIRNWLLDTGFLVNNLAINKKPLEALINKITTELNVCHKLTPGHLSCEGPQRQKVRLATQLLSHTTATALIHYKPIEDIRLLENTSNFIELVKNWFDLINVSHPNNKTTPFKAPYGFFLEEQNALLDKMYQTFLSMRCVGKFGFQIFQKAILMHINGTKILFKILQQSGFKYLLTSKINQDALENLFSQQRSRGGLNDHPSPMNTLFRLRMIILGKNAGIVSKQANTTDKNNEEFMLAKTLKQIDIKIDNVKEKHEDPESSTDTFSENSFSEIISEDKNEMGRDALEYLAGWVAKKYRPQFPE